MASLPSVTTRVLLWSLVVLTVWATLTSALTDHTMQEKAIGKDVVEAVVTKIRKSNIFTDDNQFLRRLAYVQTHDGESNTTFVSGNNGGIWNIPQIYLSYSQNKTLASFHTQINSTFQIDWVKVVWKDLLKPLYSGLAARMYMQYLNLAVPQTIADQATYFDRYFNRNDKNLTEAFVNATTELENATATCSGKMDLVIVLDGSSSVNLVNPNSFDICKRFVVDLIGSYSIKQVRHGFIVYASEVNTIFPLDNFLTMDQLANKTLNAQYPDSKTDTNAAILAAVEMFESAEPRNGVPKVLTIFTDGKSNPAGVDNIEYAKNASIASYAIGITDSVDLSELEQLAYNINSNVFSLDNFEVLNEFFKRLNAETCKIPQKPQMGDSVEDVLNEGERRFYEFSFDAEGAVRIVIDQIEGETKGFYSFSVENPSSAVNDGILRPGGTLVQPPLIPITLEMGNAYEGNSNWTTVVYLSIEGVKSFNNYTIEAQAAERDNSTTTEYTTGKVDTTTPNGGFSTTFTVSTSSIFMICVSSILASFLKEF